MEYSYRGWNFHIDESKSRQYYESIPVICEAFSEYLPELTAFFNHIGIDIRKPSIFDCADTTDLCYYAFGRRIRD